MGFSLLPPSENEGGGKNRREGFQGVKQSGSNKQDCLWKRLRGSRTSWINERKERLKNGDFTEAEFSNLMCPAVLLPTRAGISNSAGPRINRFE